MNKHILIIGGAGFIGSHIADELLQHGYRVRVLDNLSKQVHGPYVKKRPGYLDSGVELMVGDIRSPERVKRALEGIDAVLHLAAAVSTGTKLYEVTHCTSINNLGTAVLLETLRHHPVERLIVASSMSVYGEGLYRRPDGTLCDDARRTEEQLKAGDWDVRGERGEPLVAIPTPETKTLSPNTIYALSKHDQERMCLMIGRAYQIPTVILRLFNAFGPRQALSNPYTSVLSIFASRLLRGVPPLIYEDGSQQRDFVHVRDVARAFRSALQTPPTTSCTFNIGSGRAHSVREITERLSHLLGKEHLEPRVTGNYRTGDIRHCFADISLARSALGYEPVEDLDKGLLELATWLENQIVPDRFDGIDAAALAV